MAKQTIGIGTTAGDGTGDVLRVAFDKVNDNFDEVYSFTGWEQITDTTYTAGSPLVILSGVTGKILTGTVTKIQTQLPTGVTTFWNETTDKLLAVNNGDAFTLSLRFKAKMNVASGLADIDINIGGSLGAISNETILFSKGSGVEQKFDIDLSYFNTTRTILTTANNLYKSYKFILHFQLSDIAINYQIGYNTNVYNFYPPCFTIGDFNTNLYYQYDCLRSITIEEDGVHFPLDLVDGFYSATFQDINGCFIVECDESLACKVKNFIEEKFNKNCYNCNKKKDLETYMKILMYYKALNSDCLDCCARCNAYEKIINITKGCYDC